MRAIILAAGIGARLNPLAVSIPKCLLKLNNRESIIERTLRLLGAKGIMDVVLVVGYEFQEFNEIVVPSEVKLKKVYCPFYAISNNIVSLWLAKEYLEGDVIIIYSDILFSEDLLDAAMNLKNMATVLGDMSVKSGADYKIYVDAIDESGQVIVMSKDLEEYQGEYIGITHLDPDGCVILNSRIQQMIERGLLNEWYENALVDLIYTEDNFKLNFMDVSNYIWIEIDTVNDVARAKKIFGSK